MKPRLNPPAPANKSITLYTVKDLSHLRMRIYEYGKENPECILLKLLVVFPAISALAAWPCSPLYKLEKEERNEINQESSS